jgi:hypothetical protein
MRYVSSVPHRPRDATFDANARLDADRVKSRAARHRGATFGLRARLLVSVCACIGMGAGCARGPTVRTDDTRARLAKAAAPVAPDEATVRSARFVPAVIDDARVHGVEPGGGVRALAAGVRVVLLANGAVMVAEERLAQMPTATLVLPERLGGGFLFALGSTVVRADRWLGPLRTLYVAPAPVASLVAGLDRVYVRTPSGATRALDAESGAKLDLGPWPRAPFVGAFAAADAWRAVAITDLRGALATFDAGATWARLPLHHEPKDAFVSGDSLVVMASDAAPNVPSPPKPTFFDVRDGARLAPLPGPPTPEPFEGGTFRSAGGSGAGALQEALAGAAFAGMRGQGAKVFGKRPLLAAVEDGYPLEDGTALVARDGALARVRLSDGALVEYVPEAFPLASSRCHPIVMAFDGKRDALGFVCGEPRGRTHLYGYRAREGRLVLVQAYASPRAVLASGRGAIALRGACADDEGATAERPRDEGPAREPRDGRDAREVGEGGEGNRGRDGRGTSPPAVRAASANEHGYCVRGIDEQFRDLRVRGAADGERVVPLEDGRVAVLSPPHGDLAAARLTVLDASGRANTVALRFGALAPEVARTLRDGLWLEGFEERRAGVLGGWVELAGTMIGIEVALDGQAKAGAYVRELGSPMVAGRYGLGLSASRRGYETTDGGMTWTPFDSPEPLVPVKQVTSRACGPAGCTAAGWIRVGWGVPPRTPQTAAPEPERPMPQGSPAIDLVCEAASGPPPALAPASSVGATLGAPGLGRPSRPSRAVPNATRGPLTSPWGTLGSGWGQPTSDVPPFFGQAPPKLGPDEAALTIEASDTLERTTRVGPLARLYVWGPKSGDWDRTSRWVVRWGSPLASSSETRSTSIEPSPFTTVDAARRALGVGAVAPVGFSVASGDDSAHALLVARRSSPLETSIFALDADRGIAEIRRDGDPFTDVEGAVRAGGRWYLVTPQGSFEAPASVVYQVDGTRAQELVRLPRAAMDGRPVPVRLARRSDGRALGIVVDGQPTIERAVAQRWLVPIDLDGGLAGEPRRLGAADLSDRPHDRVLEGCHEANVGWIFDAPLPTTVRVTMGGATQPIPLQGATARLRAYEGGVCVERLAAFVEFAHSARLDALTARGTPGLDARDASEASPFAVYAWAARARYPLRCVPRPR